MATITPPAVSVNEYLKTTYYQDCDYVDGELQERNLGEHAIVQGAWVEWFRTHAKAWYIWVLPKFAYKSRQLDFV